MIAGRPVPSAYAGYFQAKEIGALVWGRLVYRDPFGVRLETGFGLVRGEGGMLKPGPYAGYNYYRTYAPDDPDAPHGRYGA